MPPNRFQPTAFNAQNGVPQPGQPANVQPVAADEDSKDDERIPAEDTAEDQAQPAQTMPMPMPMPMLNRSSPTRISPTRAEDSGTDSGYAAPATAAGGAVVPPPQPPQQ